MHAVLTISVQPTADLSACCGKPVLRLPPSDEQVPKLARWFLGLPISGMLCALAPGTHPETEFTAACDMKLRAWRLAR